MSLFLMPYIIPLNFSSHVSNTFLYFVLSKDKLRKAELTSSFYFLMCLMVQVVSCFIMMMQCPVSVEQIHDQWNEENNDKC